MVLKQSQVSKDMEQSECNTLVTLVENVSFIRKPEQQRYVVFPETFGSLASSQNTTIEEVSKQYTKIHAQEQKRRIEYKRQVFQDLPSKAGKEHANVIAAQEVEDIENRYGRFEGRERNGSKKNSSSGKPTPAVPQKNTKPNPTVIWDFYDQAGKLLKSDQQLKDVASNTMVLLRPRERKAGEEAKECIEPTGNFEGNTRA